MNKNDNKNTRNNKIDFFDDILESYMPIKIEDFLQLLSKKEIKGLSDTDNEHFRWFISELKSIIL